MKAFPHQINDLAKLTAALGVLELAPKLGQNPLDDGEYGSALANAGAYTFRQLTTTVADRLAQERLKPSGSQGFRTAARDLRRFFALAGLIKADCKLTDRGREIVSSKDNVALRNVLWREAMLDLSLPGADGSVSHPYRVLLKLVGQHPGIETKQLFLAFEAHDDSIAEFDRVLKLSQLSHDKALKKTGTTPASAANAVKILPSIAEQVGDIIRGKTCFAASSPTVTEDGAELASSMELKPGEGTSAIEVNPEDIAKIPAFESGAKSAFFDLAAANLLRQKRTVKHHQTVVSLAKLIASEGFKVYENPYDCLGHKNGSGSLLMEVKTLDGTKRDEHQQTIKALGQLKSYNYFNVGKKLKIPKVVEVVAFDQTPRSSTVLFMKECGVRSAWVANDQWVTVDGSGNEIGLSTTELLS